MLSAARADPDSARVDPTRSPRRVDALITVAPAVWMKRHGMRYATACCGTTVNRARKRIFPVCRFGSLIARPEEPRTYGVAWSARGWLRLTHTSARGDVDVGLICTPRDSRQARGGCPAYRLKTLVKCDWVWNPTESATSTSVMPVPTSIS